MHYSAAQSLSCVRLFILVLVLLNKSSHFGTNFVSSLYMRPLFSRPVVFICVWCAVGQYHVSDIPPLTLQYQRKLQPRQPAQLSQSMSSAASEDGAPYNRHRKRFLDWYVVTGAKALVPPSSTGSCTIHCSLFTLSPCFKLPPSGPVQNFQNNNTHNMQSRVSKQKYRTEENTN